MSSLIEGNPWLWVMVQGDVGNEQYVGQHDAENDVSFIPAFLTKDEGLKGFNLVKREKGLNMEVQAVRYKELLKDCAGNGFMLFVVDSEGTVKEKIDPNDGD
jgi:hypothetical protein